MKKAAKALMNFVITLLKSKVEVNCPPHTHTYTQAT